MKTKEDPLRRLSRTQTNAFHQHQWDAWQQAENQRLSPIKTPSQSRSPTHDMPPPKSRSPVRFPARRTPGSYAPNRPGTPDPRAQKAPTLTMEKVRPSLSPIPCLPPPKARSPPRRSRARRTPGSRSRCRPGTIDPCIQKAPTLTVEKVRYSPTKTPSKSPCPTPGVPPPKPRSPPRSTSGTHSMNRPGTPDPRSQKAPTPTTRGVPTPTPSRERPRKFRKSPSSTENNASSSPRAIASPVAVPTTIFTKRPRNKPALTIRTSFSDVGDELHEQPPRLVLELFREEKSMELFDSLDDNESGKLSLAELSHGVMMLCQVVIHMPSIIRAYKATDRCGDGFVSRSDFPFFWTYLVYYNNLWSVFSLDEDGDRRISRDEWMEAAATEKLVVGAVFDQVDANDSGKVLIDELCKYMAKDSRPKLVRDEEFVANCSKEEMLGVADGLYIVKDDGEMSH